VRKLDPETGKQRTIVRNEDGTFRAFGETTLESLVTSCESDSRRWAGNLTDRELRALVHEVGNRLIVDSKMYECQQAQLERLADAQHLAFFGLSLGAEEKEVDNAYRKLAKKMHPDKNGGTEEAKLRFQRMKERYEVLKARRAAAAVEANKSGEEEPEEELCENGDAALAKVEGQPDDTRRKEAYDEDEDDERGKKEPESRTIEYDPGDRASLHKTVFRMLGQLKMMRHGLEDLSRQLRRAGVVPAVPEEGAQVDAAGSEGHR